MLMSKIKISKRLLCTKRPRSKWTHYSVSTWNGSNIDPVSSICFHLQSSYVILHKYRQHAVIRVRSHPPWIWLFGDGWVVPQSQQREGWVKFVVEVIVVEFQAKRQASHYGVTKSRHKKLKISGKMVARLLMFDSRCISCWISMVIRLMI